MKQTKEYLSGKKYGRLTIVDNFPSDGNGRRVLATCECGITRDYRLGHIQQGRIISCGCYLRDISSERSKTHGMSGHPIHDIWSGIKARCNNIKNSRYGGRGIDVCDEWKNDFISFYNWSIKNGYRSDLQIDRRNNDLGYSPENCRWVNLFVQARNKRNNVFIEYNGETKTIAEWCEIYGITQKRFNSRIKRGWDIHRTLTAPLKIGKWKYRVEFNCQN